VIEGVLPLAQVKSLLFGNTLVSLPFAVYGGVAASSPAAAEALELEAQVIARRLGVAHLELRNTQQRHPEWPLQDLYVRFRKAIFPEVEANMLAIPRKQRAMVRKGIKNGLRSEIDRDPGGSSRFTRTTSTGMARRHCPGVISTPCSRCSAADCEVLTVVDGGGRSLSTVLSFYFRDEVLPYYAGDELSARELAANDFKYWELMRRSCERGLKVLTTVAASRAPAPMPSRRTGASSRSRCTTSIACIAAMPFRRTIRRMPSTVY
jgi:FemAB-related protein (PEP-CTERM system-associated)